MEIQSTGFAVSLRYDFRASVQGRGAQEQESGQVVDLRERASVRYSLTRLASEGDGMRVVSERVSAHLSSRLERRLPESTGESTFDGQAIQSKVLGFVANRIADEREAGATDEKVNALLDAAAEGVTKGFEEAREVLQAVGALNDSLAEQVNQTETGIQDGIAAMRPGATPAVLAPDSVPPQPASTTDNRSPVTPPASDDETGDVGVTDSRFRFGQKNTASITLKTREGDTVKLDLAAAVKLMGRSVSSGGQGGGMQALGLHYREASSLVVKGDLNDAEMQAITDLLAQVADLADTFFNGDLGEAFDQALSLTGDMTQLASYSIELKQSTRFRAAEHYHSREGIQRLAEVPDRAAGLLDKAGIFDEPIRAASSLIRSLLPELAPEASPDTSKRPALFAGYVQQVMEQLA